MKSKLAIILFAVFSLTIVIGKKSQWQKAHVLTWDKSGYYIYLPAIFIYHDLQGLSFAPAIAGKYHPAGDTRWYYLYQYPDGKRLNKYSIGTCFFELPFFLCADLYCRLSTAPRDGYSPPYQLLVAISTLFWVVIGLVILRRFLLYYYSDTTVCYTLLFIALGTNLFYYSVFDQGMSHPYSFFLFSSILFLTHKIYNDYKLKYLILLGIALGFVAIVRPVNIIIAIIPIFWMVYNSSTLRGRLLFIKSKIPHLLFALFFFCIVLSMQMRYWHLITGHWIHFSYEGESFNFLRSRLWDGLMSYRKGWFVYTPMALACLTGFITLFRKNRAYVPSLAVFWVLMIYVVFSWRMWYYGGSFGCRALIETFAIGAFLLASLVEKIIALNSAKLKSAFLTLLILITFLNVFQSYQYSLSIIHWDRMTKAYYWKVFGKTHFNEEATKYLMSDEDYNKADQDDQK